MAAVVRCCETNFCIHIVLIVFLVLFAGLMSGLTLGLMSLSLVDLEVLAKSGTPEDKQHAGIPLFFIYFYICIGFPFSFCCLFIVFPPFASSLVPLSLKLFMLRLIVGFFVSEIKGEI